MRIHLTQSQHIELFPHNEKPKNLSSWGSHIISFPNIVDNCTLCRLKSVIFPQFSSLSLRTTIISTKKLNDDSTKKIAEKLAQQPPKIKIQASPSETPTLTNEAPNNETHVEVHISIPSELKVSFVDNEHKNNALFLMELQKTKEFFARHDYGTIADHYEKTIKEFEALDTQLDDLANRAKYVKDWNALLTKFDGQHQLFLQLKDVEKEYEACGDEVGEKLLQYDAENDDENFEKIANFIINAPDISERKKLHTSEDIEAYINMLSNFLKEVREGLATPF